MKAHHHLHSAETCRRKDTNPFADWNSPSSGLSRVLVQWLDELCAHQEEGASRGCGGGVDGAGCGDVHVTRAQAVGSDEEFAFDDHAFL